MTKRIATSEPKQTIENLSGWRQRLARILSVFQVEPEKDCQVNGAKTCTERPPIANRAKG